MKPIKAKRKDWIEQFKVNSAISDVIWGIGKIDGNEIKAWVGLTPSTKPFANFINEIENRLFNNKVDIAKNFHYDQIVEYAHQNNQYKVMKVCLYASDFISIKEDWGRLLLAPYNDGVMIYGINVKKELRGKGIGTDIMNKLYDISEELNIPLYLIPYPDDNFKSKDEKKLVDRLKVYYNKIGFGPISDTSLVWSNFE